MNLYVVINNIDDCLLLQRGLNNLSEWAEKWQLKISISKCAVLNIGSSNIKYVYDIDNAILPNVESIVDLGVTMSSDLRFKQHQCNG